MRVNLTEPLSGLCTDCVDIAYRHRHACLSVSPRLELTLYLLLSKASRHPDEVLVCVTHAGCPAGRQTASVFVRDQACSFYLERIMLSQGGTRFPTDVLWATQAGWAGEE